MTDRPGDQNSPEDRGRGDSVEEEAEPGVTWLGQYTITDLKKVQSEDPDLAPVLSWLESTILLGDCCCRKFQC